MVGDLPVGSLVFDAPERLTDIASWHTHVPFGFWCVETLRPRVLVELGTHKGDSYCAFCQAVDRLSLPTACYAVDTWKGDHEAGFYGEEILEELTAHHDPRYAAFSRLVRSTFDEAVQHFTDGSVDLLHIDGLHTYEAARHDFETWLPKLSRSAVVLFHDVNVRERDFGAWRLWEELCARYPHFTFLHGHGLGVLVVGPEAPAPALRLAGCSEEEATELREFFARQGRLCALRDEAGRKEAEVAVLRAVAAKRDDELASLQERLGDAEAAAAGLQRQVREQEETADRLRAEISGLGAQNAASRKALADAEGRIGDLQRASAQGREEAAAREQRNAASLRASDATIQALQAERVEAWGTVERIRGSRTWRAARKLESVARVPRRLAHVLRVAGEILYWTATLQLRQGLRRRKYARLIRRSGLFDVEFYLAQCGSDDLAKRDPILHYLVRGAMEGMDPNPLFDSSWYLQRNPDVAAAFAEGKNPLVHYIRSGAAERRDPSPGFDTASYLRRHPVVAERGLNPLAHDLACRAGARSAGPSLLVGKVAPARENGGDAAVRGAEAPSAGGVRAPVSQETWSFQPHLLGDAPAVPAPVGRRVARTILVGHVLPFPPRAGNEYRIHRLLKWLRSLGHEVHVLLCPLPGEFPAPELIRQASKEYPNLVLCERDGKLHYQSERADVRAALAALGGKRSRSLLTRDHEGEGRLANVERTFCPDPLVDLLLRLEQVVQPEMVIASYVFASRSLLGLGGGVLKVIDTHDVFSTKSRKVVRYGVAADLAMSADEERAMLLRADLIMAIQPAEEQDLKAIVPDRQVVTAGVDFDLAGEAPAPVDPVVLVVASGNALNVKGIRDFLSLAWPLVRREVPDARLRLVGPVCEAVEAGVDGIELLGRVDRLDDAYSQARVVINPAVAGTGVKIKTLEALAHLRPIVVWPLGVDGLSPGAKALCHVARDWYDFARRVASLLSGDRAREMVARREEIGRFLAPETVYAALREAVEEGMRGARGKASSNG